MADGVPEGCPVCPTEDDGLPVWVNLLISVAMVGLSALFSGLGLGLLSLDKKGLQILAETGTPDERRQASHIIPLRKNGNLLLCTLLLGNVVVNSCLSILLAGLTSGLVGLLSSTSLIVVFGEIIPQSLCSRHGLRIGSSTRHITWFFVGLFWVIAKPISMCLDYALGEEMGNLYSRDGLKRLLQMHAEEASTGNGPTLTKDEQNLLSGAMEYSRKTVADVMTHIDRVFMLESNMKLTFETMMQIYKSGYTRIPVYEGDPNNIMGILYVKDLILVDPDDEIEVQTVVTFRGPTQVRFILDTTPLNEVFKIFKASYTHLMIAVTLRSALTGQRIAAAQLATAPQYVLLQAEKEVTGVITLEDILEEVIKAEIVDEHDVYLSNDQQERIKTGRDRPDVSTFLSLFEHKVRESTKLSRQEVQAVCAFLVARVQQFAPFAAHRALLRQLIRRAELISDEMDDVESSGSANLELELSEAKPGERIGRHHVLYKRGEPTTRFSLVLQGWVYIWAGAEEFESEAGPWSHLGNLAMDSETETYVPDFSAATQGGPCRILQFERADFLQALEQCKVEARDTQVQPFDPVTPLVARGRRGVPSGSLEGASSATPVRGRHAHLSPALRGHHSPLRNTDAARLSPRVRHCLHTQNHSGISSTIACPPELSEPFTDLLNAEYSPGHEGTALLRGRRTDAVSDEEHSESGVDWSQLRSSHNMIEMANMGPSTSRAPDSAPRIQSIEHSSSFVNPPGVAQTQSDSTLSVNPGVGSVGDFDVFVSPSVNGEESSASLRRMEGGLPKPSPSGRVEPQSSRNGESSSRHALDGVIVVGADGIPICVEDGKPRVMALFDTQQRAEHADSSKPRGFVPHLRPSASSLAHRASHELTCVGEHSTLFMDPQHAALQDNSPLDASPDVSTAGGKRWFASSKQADELPLIPSKLSSTYHAS